MVFMGSLVVIDGLVLSFFLGGREGGFFFPKS